MTAAYAQSDIDRVVARLDAIAPQWRALPVGSALAFEWPSVHAMLQPAVGTVLSLR